MEFGLQNEFEESVTRLAAAFGWKIGNDIKISKATRIEKDMNDEDRAAVVRWNKLDQDLFDFAEELFRKRGMS